MEERMRASDMESADIFLSYSHEDKEVVHKIAALLSKAGFNCWLDTDRLFYGDKYTPKIFGAIQSCVVFIAFLSKSYVNKTYCSFEFTWAQEHEKSMLAVTLDDVTENTNPDAAYMFVHKYGESDPAYGRTVTTDDDAHFVAQELQKSAHLRTLKSYYESGDAQTLPSVKLPTKLLSLLELYNKEQYKQDGNYALSDIKGELFPAIKDVDAGASYKDEQNAVSSLIKYIDKDQGKGARKNLFLFGDGGMGKTVTMLKTAEYLLEKGIPAIYIPLSKIDKDTTIEKYLRMHVCNGMEVSWKILRDTMSYAKKDAPSVILLLDGVNELPADRELAKNIVKKIKDEFIDGYKGVDLIMTSRWFDPYILNSIKEYVIQLEMQKLDKFCINKYLASVDIPAVNDEKMLSVLSTPLLLSLYADVERHKDKYQHIGDIALVERPDTPAKVLQNFFQTQLFRAADEANFDRGAHYVLLEYMLPAIAYRMTRKQTHKMVLSLDDILDIQDEMEDRCPRYKWYSRDRLRRIFQGRCDVDISSLLTLAENALHFLHKTADGYALHQSFRDYFAACHIANEMAAFCKDGERVREVSPVLEETCLDSDILCFVADLVCEENAMPRKENGHWVLPAQEDAQISQPEQLLALWRNQEGEKAQNAVYNLFEVMRIGRKRLLFGCDFSGLDFRKCTLGKNAFVEWENDTVYPSRFDGACIDLSAFVVDGHDCAVTAVCTDDENILFSGDKNGVVKVFDLHTQKCLKTLEFQNSAVTDIAWHTKTKRLAVMYKNAVYVYVYETDTHTVVQNGGANGDFRYVGFDENGELTVSYSLEPLMIKHISGQTASFVSDRLQYDVPARCAKWNPAQNGFARSMLFQALSIVSLNENGAWWVHPVLTARMSKDTKITPQEQLDVSQAFERAKEGKKVQCSRLVDPNRTNKRLYLLQLGRSLYVYNEQAKRATHKRSFNADISRVNNNAGQITVEMGSIAIILTADLNFSGAYLRLKDWGAKNNSGINCSCYSKDGSRLLIAIQNQLFEIETAGLTLVRKKELSGVVGSACYFQDKVIVSANAQIYVLNEDFSENTVFEAGNTADIKYYIDDREKDGCYIVTASGTVKKLDGHLVVQRMRKVEAASKMILARECKTGKTVIVFKNLPDYPFGAALDFENNTISCLCGEHDLIGSFFGDTHTHYILNNQLIAYEKVPPFAQKRFKNYSGISIYGCSFLNIKGDIAKPEGKHFIRQNGGLVND